MHKFWTDEEDAILRRHYPTKGACGCAEFFPGRSQQSISSRARKRLGLVSNVPRSKPKTYAYREFINRIDEDWKKLVTEIPEDTRTPGQRLMGEPIFERSALYRKQMEAQ